MTTPILYTQGRSLRAKFSIPQLFCRLIIPFSVVTPPHLPIMTIVLNAYVKMFVMSPLWLDWKDRYTFQTLGKKMKMVIAERSLILTMTCFGCMLIISFTMHNLHPIVLSQLFMCLNVLHFFNSLMYLTFPSGLEK